MCDFHDGKGTCQGPHGHGGEETASEATGDSDHATGSTGDHATGGSTGGAQVGEACAGDVGCAGELVCHDEGGVKTCQESHAHAR